ncbi:MAG TPA: malto-oligosyltrehalose synthase [Thermoanaerobaculia bacterium]|jgi:(1->4)-alpha-D-glucan 1-alpha-D-glucosylmutase|nr:malto-oligosyltrehalose synthase [Thermoanaerobaculia bacterium]
MRIPTATYRLQFNAAFPFQDAKRIVAYLHELGISDLYASPLLRPRKGSTHGYDIVDANALNPELGTDVDFTELHGELDRFDMGLLLDIVPNHMAASHENAWWVSVLENGPQSRFLYYFDIDWRDDKVLLPILGRPYGETLESGEIRLGFDAEGLFFSYYDKRLPLSPQSYRIVLEPCVDAVPAEGIGIEVRDLVQNETVVANSRFLKDTLHRLREESPAFLRAMDDSIARFNADPDQLDRVVQAQWYRLAYWRIASETINYRRFFDVTDLVGIRVENPEVFEARNRLILDLIAQGKVTGVRIDHIDGLHDPTNYLTKLQHRLGGADDFYVVVEKVLEHGELLPPSFRCAGTTGYDFLDTVSALFVDPAGLESLTDFYQRYTGITASYEDVVYERKKQVIELLFFGEMRALGAHLVQLAVADRNARDFAPTELLAALIEITACLPVYRTYVREPAVSDADRAVLTQAIREARQRARQVDARLLDFLELVLLLEPPAYIASEREKWLEFVMRWQQFTGRVMAKGVEDTAFYNYNRLISLNEVGGEPGRGEFDPIAEFHARNAEIASAWPHTMNATSTHDTKRSEDVRARINVLSEIPDAWERAVRKWSRINAPLKRDGVPHANEELMIYQTLVGAWPLDGPRLREYLVKAAREAKMHTSWISVNESYENALTDFANAILAHEPFLASFRRFQKRVAYHGFLNSLAQVVLKVCSPGVPDFYQGSELWDYSLVDPDNRRPVDYAHRAALLSKLGTPAEMLRSWEDGRVKLFVTVRSLAVRRRLSAAAYRAVDTGTPHAVAFLRGDDVLVAVPRLTTTLTFGEHALNVPGRWRNVFTEETLDSLELKNVFASFPVAIFERA